MSHKIITAHFTGSGIPHSGLTPTIDIYELSLVNPIANPQIVTAGALTEIGAGWYRYDFLTYDSTKNYVYTIDGGGYLDIAERFKIGGNESYVEEVSTGVWNQQTLDHLAAGTTGFALTQIQSNTSSIAVSQAAITSMVNTILKYERNRTKIDLQTHTLTVYDDDGTTPLTTFNLKDYDGNLSIAEITERVPI